MLKTLYLLTGLEPVFSTLPAQNIKSFRFYHFPLSKVRVFSVAFSDALLWIEKEKTLMVRFEDPG